MRAPNRRFFDFDLDSLTPTVIGEQSVVVGDIRGEGQFVVSGEVHGDGKIDGGLNLSVTGVWNGHVRGAARGHRGQDHGRTRRCSTDWKSATPP